MKKCFLLLNAMVVGCILNAAEQDKRKELADAIDNGDYAYVKELIEKVGTPINDLYGYDNRHTYTPLIRATTGYHTKITDLLIDHPACNVNIPCWDGTTALHRAAQQGRILLVKKLVKRGADVNALCACHMTPLHWAIGHQCLAIGTAEQINHNETIKFLVSMGCNLNITDRNGSTPLYYACLDDNDSAIRKLLIAHGANIKKIQPQSPLALRNEYNAQQINRQLDKWHRFMFTCRPSWTAFAAALHPRCGANSPVRLLCPNLVQTVCLRSILHYSPEEIGAIMLTCELPSPTQHNQMQDQQQQATSSSSSRCTIS